MAGQLMRKGLGIFPAIRNHPRIQTHFLCLPLCNPRSRAQLQTLVETLRSDEASIGNPSAAFRLPNSFHLLLCSLRIEILHDLHAASGLLRSLDVNGILERESSDLQARCSGQVKSNPSKTRCQVEIPPVNVTLEGIEAFPQVDKATSADSPFQADLDRVTMLVCNFRHMFVSISNIGQPLQPRFTPEKVLAPNLLHTRYARKRDLAVGRDGHVRDTYRAAPLDLGGLCEKYKDTVWVKDLQIEKLSLCKEGRVKTFGGPNNSILVDEEFEEVASIALPQYIRSRDYIDLLSTSAMNMCIDLPISIWEPIETLCQVVMRMCETFATAMFYHNNTRRLERHVMSHRHQSRTQKIHHLTDCWLRLPRVRRLVRIPT